MSWEDPWFKSVRYIALYQRANHDEILSEPKLNEYVHQIGPVILCVIIIPIYVWSESSLFVCRDIKEFLAVNRHQIWNLSTCNGRRTHNHLVRKRTLKYLAKLARWLSCVVKTYLHDALTVCFCLSCHIIRVENKALDAKWLWVRIKLQLLWSNVT